MALVEHRVDGNDGNLGCYYALATWRVHTYLDSVTWRGHNSSNCEEAILRINSNGLMHYDTLVWAGGGSRQMFDNAWAWSVGVQTVARGPKNMAKGGSACSGGIGCCFCLCGGVDYWLDGWNADVRINSGTTQVGSSCQCLGNHSGDAIYNLPNNLRILPPTGLSVTFPTSIGNNLSASISKWSSNSNIGGVPTNLPNAKYWNWAVDLLDKNGNMLAHYADNKGSSKSVSLPTNAFYTASGLPGSSAAAGSRYYTKANMAYKLRVVVNNEFNQQQQSTSSTIYTKPPAPSVTITSCVYDPATKKCVLTFDWSKASDGGAYTETVKYDVYDAAGKYYVTGGTLKTVTGGAAASGSGVTVTGLASGEQIFVKVYVTATSGTSTTTKSTYSPVANAAFLGFDWDELRRTVTVRAEAPGAANCRIQAGDAPNKYNLGNQLTSGEVGTIVLKDLPHGDGQALYLQAVPEASNGYQYINEIAKVTVPVPNPILGVLTPPCGSPEEQRYIVDIVEKKADCSVTPKWQVGDRVKIRTSCESGGTMKEKISELGGGLFKDVEISIPSPRVGRCSRGVFFPDNEIVFAEVSMVLPDIPSTAVGDMWAVNTASFGGGSSGVYVTGGAKFTTLADGKIGAYLPVKIRPILPGRGGSCGTYEGAATFQLAKGGFLKEKAFSVWLQICRPDNKKIRMWISSESSWLFPGLDETLFEISL